MSENDFIKVEVVASIEGVGGYETSLLNGVINLAYDLAKGDNPEAAPKVLRLAAEIIEGATA